MNKRAISSYLWWYAIWGLKCYFLKICFRGCLLIGSLSALSLLPYLEVCPQIFPRNVASLVVEKTSERRLGGHSTSLTSISGACNTLSSDACINRTLQESGLFLRLPRRASQSDRAAFPRIHSSLSPLVSQVLYALTTEWTPCLGHKFLFLAMSERPPVMDYFVLDLTGT